MNGGQLFPAPLPPLNLKAIPEERAEIVHGKAWLLDEVFWGGNSCWGGVEFPEKDLSLSQLSHRLDLQHEPATQ